MRSLLKGESTIVINCVTGESKSFILGREAAVFIGINKSALAKYIGKQNFYLGRGFFVYKSFFFIWIVFTKVKLIKKQLRV